MAIFLLIIVLMFISPAAASVLVIMGCIALIFSSPLHLLWMIPLLGICICLTNKHDENKESLSYDESKFKDLDAYLRKLEKGDCNVDFLVKKLYAKDVIAWCKVNCKIEPMFDKNHSENSMKVTFFKETDYFHFLLRWSDRAAVKNVTE